MANRFAVASGTWTAVNTAIWSATSGGAPGASVPVAGDDVFFDAASGAITVTTSGTTVDVCRSIDCTGFTGTLNHAASTTIIIGDGTAGAGNIAFRLVAGMTYTIGGAATSALTFQSTSVTQQDIVLGGKTVSSVTVNGNGASYRFVGTFTQNITASFTLLRGTVDTNSVTVGLGSIITTGALTRVLTLGTSAVTIQGTFTYTGSGFTLNYTNGSTIVFSGSATTLTFGGLSFPDMTINGGGAGVNILGANTYRALTLQAVAPTSNNKPGFSFPAGVTQTITNTFTVVCTTAGRLMVYSATDGSAATISAATTVIDNAVFRDIAGTGAATWTGTLVGDGQGNSGITFAVSQTNYWVGTSVLWSVASNWASTSGGVGGTGRIPLVQDDVVFDTGGTTGCQLDAPWMCRNLNGSATNKAFAISGAVSFQQGWWLFGSITMPVGVVTWQLNTTRNFIMAGRQGVTVTSNGKAMWNSAMNSFQVRAASGTVSLVDAYTATTTFQVLSGTFDANDQDVTFENFVSTTVVSSVLMGNGIWTILGAVTTSVWNGGAGTISAEGSTLVYAYTGASARNASLGGNTYNKFVVQAGGAGVLTVNQSNTFDTFTVYGPKFVTFQNTTTQTINHLEWLGTSGNLVTIRSNSASQIIFNVTDPHVFFADLQRVTVNPAAVAFNSTDSGSNVNWTFTNSPIAFTAAVTDPIGVSDSSVAAGGGVVVDPVGLLDAVSTVAAAIVTDLVGISDAVAAAAAVPLTDPIGITDTSVAAGGGVVVDPVGLLDDTRADIGASITDSVGITDDTASAAATTVTDPVGIVDDVTGELGSTITDPIGLTDQFTAAAAVPLTDPVGIVDDILPTAGSHITISDPIGITDASRAELGAIITDLIGITDRPTAAIAATIQDQIGVTDRTAATAAIALTDPVGITDLALAGLTATISDLVGITDSTVRELAVQLADLVGITDTAAAHALLVYALKCADITITPATAVITITPAAATITITPATAVITIAEC